MKILNLIFISFVMTTHLKSQEVVKYENYDWEENSFKCELMSSFKLDNILISLDKPRALISKSISSGRDDTYLNCVVDGYSFMVFNGIFYFNGQRMKLSFDKKIKIILKDKKLYLNDKIIKSIPYTKADMDYFFSRDNRITYVDEISGMKINFPFIQMTNGGSNEIVKGFSFVHRGWVVGKIQKKEFWLWDVNYGEIGDNVTINVKDNVLLVDGEKEISIKNR